MGQSCLAKEAQHLYISPTGQAGSRGLEPTLMHSHLEISIDLDRLKHCTSKGYSQGDSIEAWSLVFYSAFCRRLCNAQSSSALY